MEAYAEIEKSYRKVFTQKSEEDTARILFLEFIAEGKVPYKDKRTTIEEALEDSGMEYSMADCFNSEEEQAINELRAMKEIRDWYAHRQPVNEGIRKIKPILQEARLHYIMDELADCLRVLEIYRNSPGQAQMLLHNAFQTARPDRIKAVYATTEYLRQIKNKNVKRYANKTIKKFEKHLKYRLRKALKRGNNRKILLAIQNIEDTHSIRLLNYTINILESSNAFESATREAISAHQDDSE